MMTLRFKLPPLEGDDVAMLMERDMLRRWGFLGQQQIKASTKTSPIDKNEPRTNSPTNSDSTSIDDSTTSSDDDSDDDSDGSKNNDDDNQENKETTQDNGDINQKSKEEVQGCSADAQQTQDMVKVKEKSDHCSESQDIPKKDEKNTEEHNEVNCTGKDNKDKHLEDKNGDDNFEKKDQIKELENDSSSNDISDTATKENVLSKEMSDGAGNETEGENRTITKGDGNVEAENATKRPGQEHDDGSSVNTTREMEGEVLMLYQEACRHYDDGEFCECMLSVEEALELSFGDCLECDEDDGDVGLTQLWLLRAKVMNSMENYKEALRSAYKVKAKERPSRLWIEGAIAMEKLGIQVTAEMWIAMGMHKWQEEGCVTSDAQESWDAAVNSDVMYVLKMMQNRLRTERIFGPLVVDKPIKVKTSIKYNRTVHATKKMKKGETIFQELPDILEQSIRTHHITACAECAKSLVQPEDVISKSEASSVPNLNADIKKGLRKVWPKLRVVSCSFCKEVKYCSQECRQKSWDNHHKVICPSNTESTEAMLYDVRRSFHDVMAADGSTWQGWWNAEYSPTLLSRMTAVVLCKANQLADLRSQDCYSEVHWSMCEAILEKYSPCDKMHAVEVVPKMQELLNNIFKRSKFLRYNFTREVFNKRFSQAMTNAIEFHDTTHPMNNFAQRVKAENEKVYKKIKKCDGKVLEKKTKAVFHGLFPLASCLNHSCYPNAVIESAPVESKPGIIVRAVRDMKEGDEILISYVPPQMERHDRRKILWSNYKFICECPRCLHQGIGPHVCTNCGKNAKDNSQSKDLSATTKEDVFPAGATDQIKIYESGNESQEVDEESKEIPDTHQDIISDATPPSQQLNSKNCSFLDSLKNPDTIHQDTASCDNGEFKTVSNDSNEGVGVFNPGAENNINDSTKLSRGDSDKDSRIQGYDQEGNERENGTPDVTSINEQNIIQSDCVDFINCNDDDDVAILKSESKIGGDSESDGIKLVDVSRDECLEDQTSDSKTVMFAACGRCKRAWYCSVKCQKDSWTSGHKKICCATDK